MKSLYFVLFCGLLLLTACNKGPQSDLVGVWRSPDGLLTIRSDGSCVFTPLKGDVERYGHWNLVEPRLTISGFASDVTIAFDLVSVGKDQMNLRTVGERASVITFARVSDHPAPPSRAELAASTPEGKRAFEAQEQRATPASIDLAVLKNARELSIASDQYFLDNATTYAERTNLVGPTNYIKSLTTVASESYPEAYTQGVTITVTGIANARTITYSP